MSSQHGNASGGREFDAYHGPHSNPPLREKVEVLWRERQWERLREEEAAEKKKADTAKLRLYGIWMGGAAAASTFISTIAAAAWAIWRNAKGGP